MIASALCRNGHPKMRGTLSSSSICRITKSAGNINFPTWTSIFSAIPIGYWYVWLAKRILILVGFEVFPESEAYSEYGIRLMLAPRSAKANYSIDPAMVHGIRKLSGSPSLDLSRTSRNWACQLVHQRV
ncbi:hypothetical protein Tco_0225419, partial [Tanacetum coccineum]